MAASAMATMDAVTVEGIRSTTAPMIHAPGKISSTGSFMNVVVRSAASR